MEVERELAFTSAELREALSPPFLLLIIYVCIEEQAMYRVALLVVRDHLTE